MFNPLLNLKHMYISHIQYICITVCVCLCTEYVCVSGGGGVTF